MLTEKQAKAARNDFVAVREGAWYSWFRETLSAKREAALTALENSPDWDTALKAKAESKTLREVIDMLNKFDERTDG